MFKITTNSFGHKEATYTSPTVKGSTKLKDKVTVLPSSTKPLPSQLDENGNFVGKISYSQDYKGTDVTLPNGLRAGMGQGGSSGASVGDGPHDVPTENEAFEKTLHQAAVGIARHHSHVNTLLAASKEDIDAQSSGERAFHESRVGKPCSFCGETITSQYDSQQNHRVMSNGWCENAFSAVHGGGHWQDDKPEHNAGDSV